MLSSGADRHALERIDAFVGAGGDVEPQDRVRVDVVGPHLAVDVEVPRHHHRLLRRVAVECRRQREQAEGRGLWIEARKPALEHQREPPVAVGIGLQRQRPGREIGLRRRVGELHMGAGTRVEPADIGFDEVGVPDVARAVGAHVVRRDGVAGQRILGDHDARCRADRPRQRLEGIVPAVAAAEVDRRQILRDFAGAFVRNLAVDDARLHPLLGRVVGVIRHALEHADEFVGREARTHHALERVAAHALDQRPLLLGRTGHAHQPFCGRELGRNIGDLAQGEVRARRVLGRDVGSCGGGAKLIAGGTDL
jgi:hypothetical protein